MEVKEIGPEHARALGRLEAECYPSDLCLGWQDFQTDLREAEARNGNFSLGLFEGSEIVGYLVAYVQDEEIYVSDLAILPTNRADRNLVMLLGEFFQAASRRKVNIVADCRESTYRMSIKHPRFFRRYGYVLTHCEEDDIYYRELRWEIRFDYVG